METRKPKKYLSGLKVNRMHCLECSGYSPSEIGRCTVIDCACWPGRYGIRPETAEKKGYLVNPYSASGMEYQYSDMDEPETYKVIEGTLWWELGFRNAAKKYGIHNIPDVPDETGEAK